MFHVIMRREREIGDGKLDSICWSYPRISFIVLAVCLRALVFENARIKV